MLLSFNAENYKSFQTGLELNMIPKPRIKDLDYSVLSEKAGRKSYKALCSAVIYGPNAAGKTNLISALDTFKSIVLRGNIRNVQNSISRGEDTFNAASQNLELIPNRFSSEKDPVKFEIEFVDDGLLVKYELEIALGKFFQKDFKRKVLKETLFINNKEVFNRTNGKIELNLKDEQIVKYFQKQIVPNSDWIIALTESTLDQDELFLSGAFRLSFSKKLAGRILSWFEKKLLVVMKSNQVIMLPESKFLDSHSVLTKPLLNEVVQEFGIHNNKIGYVLNEKTNEVDMVSVLTDKDDDKQHILIPSQFYESYGTIRLLNLFPAVIIALATGATLVVDEMDASLHPMLLLNILNIFHNDEVNVNKAQLIFNTHNPIFLDNNTLRRDEMKFVDREKECSSETYSMADFGTEGENSVRKNEDFIKHYFLNKYGAIKRLDFTEIIEEMVGDYGE